MAMTVEHKGVPIKSTGVVFGDIIGWVGAHGYGVEIWWCEVHEMKGIEDMCGWTRVKNVKPGTCRMTSRLLLDPYIQ